MNYQDFVTPHENLSEVPADYLFERIRNWRNTELALCDWTQLADSTVNKELWAIYRKALRDLPAQNTDPKKIKFPVAPNETPTS
jgi:hypothetical protein